VNNEKRAKGNLDKSLFKGLALSCLKWVLVSLAFLEQEGLVVEMDE